MTSMPIEPVNNSMEGKGPSSRAIAVDLPCFQCRYNLRTLLAGSNCPECGTPVADSIDYCWLPLADPVWLRTLQSGLGLAFITMIVSTAIAIALGVFSALGLAGEDESTIMRRLQAPVLFVIAAFGLAWTVILMKLTAPEPSHIISRSKSPIRGWVFALNTVSALLIILGIGLVFFSMREPGGEKEWLGVLLVFAIPSIPFLAAGFVLLLIHMRRLARRVIDNRLAKLMTWLIWSNAILPVTIFLAFSCMAVIGSRAVARAGTPATGPSATTVGIGTQAPLATGTATSSTAPFATASALEMRIGIALLITMIVSNLAYVISAVGLLIAMMLFRNALKFAIDNNQADRVFVDMDEPGSKIGKSVSIQL